MKPQHLAILFAVTAASACAVGPHYVRPEIPMPPAWPGDLPGEVVQAGGSLEQWWTMFQDPLLDTLARRAIEGNLDLRIASARIREARAARGIAAAAALPQVDGSASYGRIQRSDAVPPFKAASGAGSPFGAREQNLFEAGFDASWELDLFGSVRRDKEAALAAVQATEEERRDTLVTLLADVARNYVELRGVQRQLRILDETLRSQEDTLGLVKVRADAGLVTELDVARAEGLIASTGSQRPILTRTAGEAMHRLGVLLGKGPAALTQELATPGAIPPAPPAIPLTLPSELLSRRPDLRRIERELAVATARVGVARADLFPRFAILGSFGRRSEAAGDLGSASSQFWNVIPGIRWPLLSGGRIRANIRVQDARLEQASGQYEKAILVALEDVADALLAYNRERERQDLLRAAADANRRALEISLERYIAGLESFLSVLDAQRSVHAADDALVQSERNVALSVIAICKALGGGWSQDIVPAS